MRPLHVAATFMLSAVLSSALAGAQTTAVRGTSASGTPAATPEAPAAPPPTAASEPAALSEPAAAPPEPLGAEPAPEPPVAAEVAAPTAPTSGEGKVYEPAFEPLKLQSGTGSMRFGVLFQPQFEIAGSAGSAETSKNLFVRRTRILIGATLHDDFEFFFDTDFSNLFRANAEGVKATPGMNVQDAYFTYKPLGDLFKVDVGYLLPPLSHNALQSAATLLSWDYFANTFRHSNAFSSSADPAGRDVGLQLRGLVLDSKLEYRAGVFQGLREPATPTEPAGNNSFRFAGRLQVNIFDAEPGFFYGGSYLGAKRILSVGGFFELQAAYKHWGADAFLDLPAGPGVATVQVNYNLWDGGDFIAMPKQSALLAEAGYTINQLRLAPIVRFETRSVTGEVAANPDELRYGGGLAFWAYGHNFNVKAFYMRIDPYPGLYNYGQFNLQAQLFAF